MAMTEKKPKRKKHHIIRRVKDRPKPPPKPKTPDSPPRSFLEQDVRVEAVVRASMFVGYCSRCNCILGHRSDFVNQEGGFYCRACYESHTRESHREREQQEAFRRARERNRRRSRDCDVCHADLGTVETSERAPWLCAACDRRLQDEEHTREIARRARTIQQILDTRQEFQESIGQQLFLGTDMHRFMEPIIIAEVRDLWQAFRPHYSPPRVRLLSISSPHSRQALTGGDVPGLLIELSVAEMDNVTPSERAAYAQSVVRGQLLSNQEMLLDAREVRVYIMRVERLDQDDVLTVLLTFPPIVS